MEIRRYRKFIVAGGLLITTLAIIGILPKELFDLGDNTKWIYAAAGGAALFAFYTYYINVPKPSRTYSPGPGGIPPGAMPPRRTSRIVMEPDVAPIQNPGPRDIRSPDELPTHEQRGLERPLQANKKNIDTERIYEGFE